MLSLKAKSIIAKQRDKSNEESDFIFCMFWFPSVAVFSALIFYLEKRKEIKNIFSSVSVYGGISSLAIRDQESVPTVQCFLFSPKC